MKIIISKENYTIKGDYIKIGEVYDKHHLGIFLKGLIDDADDNDPKFVMTLKVDYIPDAEDDYE